MPLCWVFTNRVTYAYGTYGLKYAYGTEQLILLGSLPKIIGISGAPYDSGDFPKYVKERMCLSIE